MALEQELATYRRELPNLLIHTGKFAVIHQDSVAGIWNTYADALREGYRVFGLESFMVKRIEPVEFVHNIPREITPTCRS
jgi:hypothetical protein